MIKRKFTATRDTSNENLHNLDKENCIGYPHQLSNSLQKQQPKTPAVKIASKGHPHSFPSLPLQEKSNISHQDAKNKQAASRKKMKNSDTLNESVVGQSNVPWTTKRILATLRLEGFYKNEKIESPLDLFRLLEKDGKLTENTLKIFSRHPTITSANLSESFATRFNDLLLPAKILNDASRCTMPFYNSFPNLKILDLTNIPIKDEQLRYLITLELKAVGFSGTNISNRGLRYLAKYAKFTKTLERMKLCFISKVDDSSIAILKKFSLLSDIDLLGTNVTPSAVPQLFDVNGNLLYSNLKLPNAVFYYLRDLHASFSAYSEIQGLTAEPGRALDLANSDALKLLKIFKKFYLNVYLNATDLSVQQYLESFLKLRRMEELVWNAL